MMGINQNKLLQIGLCVFLLVVTRFPENFVYGQTANRIEFHSAFLQVESEANVPAREPGVLDSIFMKVGQDVEVDDTIAKIDDRATELLMNKAELEVQIAAATAQSNTNVRLYQKELEIAESELKIGESSRDKFDRSISQLELDQLKLAVVEKTLKLEEAQVENSNAKLKEKLVRNELQVVEALKERHRIKSPLTGTVVEVFKNPGEWVKPGDAVCRVITLKSLKVVGFVDASVATPDLIGRTVNVVSDQGGKKISRKGVIIFVSPEVDPVNRHVQVWARVPNEDKRLSPGRRVNVSIGSQKSKVSTE